MEPHLSAAQQYFPTYKLNPEQSEIGLREYDLAAKALEADHRSLTAAAGIVLFSLGALATLLGSNVGSGLSALERQAQSGWWGLTLAVVIGGVLAVHYFSLLQRSATYAARKIVVLRRLLGLDYGNIEMVLPADRLEGANEPFFIPMFPGWRSLPALPVVVVMTLGFVAQLMLVSAVVSVDQGYAIAGVSPSPMEAGVAVGGATAVLFATMYRYALFETFETMRFAFGRAAGWFVGTPLKRRTGHVLYRMRLAVFEARRLKIRLSDLHPMLVFIEDRRYFEHGGNSLRAAMAAAYRYMRYGAKSGGSTICQQLVRTNLLTRLKPKLRRKMLEWILAPWAARLFPGAEGLDAYLCSVRFALGVNGIVDAIRHYFPDQIVSRPLERHQRFLLIERLSNVSGTFAAARVNSLARSALGHDLLLEADFALLTSAYRNLVDRKVIAVPEEGPPLVTPGDSRGLVVSN